MRVLIVLALIGVAYAGDAILAPATPFLAPAAPLLAPAPYSSLIVDQPKPSYEYSTQVQTPTYNNYAYVRSGGNFERKIYNFAAPFAAAPVVAAAATPIAAAVATPAEPIIAEAKFVQPAIAQPLLRTAALAEYASPAFALPTTKLLPIQYESKPFYRFAAPAAIAAAPAAVAAPAFVAPAAQILTVDNKLIGEGKSQYHSQNSFGEATYGHRESFQSHDAVQDAQGNKAGSFSYISPDGRILTTDYVADQAGYRVASNAFPNAPNQPVAIAAQPVAVAAAAFEKPAEVSDSEIVVEAKSRNRRSIALAAAAPAVIAPATIRAAPIYTAPRPTFYSNPLAYSSYAYTAPAYTAPALSYSYAAAPSYASTYSYSTAAAPTFYNAAPLYRSYAYSYPSASSSYFYRNLAFRK